MPITSSANMKKQAVTLHHVEMCVGQETEILHLLKNGFNFEENLYRNTTNGEQWVLNRGRSTFIITKSCSLDFPKGPEDGAGVKSNQKCHVNDECDYPVLACCEQQDHVKDKAFNVALEVTHLEDIMSKIRLGNGRVIKDIHTIHDECGYVRMSIISSKCDNVIHTLLDKTHYKGEFLPGFKLGSRASNGLISSPPGCPLNYSPKALTEFMDHITYVCQPGESTSIIRWYEDCFSMKRFLVNKDETDEGFVLEGSIGLRIKALLYWRCAETGVAFSNCSSTETIFRIVIAEPLPSIETSHVTTFLRENSGPGIQHIGLHTCSIIDCVKELQRRGIRFRKPPPTYYEECGKYNDIEDVGLAHRVGELRECGILLDAETDAVSNDNNKKYLMQIFTYPIFKEDTFFLEVIQRCGATGFGAGNITALSKSIVRYQEEMNLLKKLETSNSIDVQYTKPSLQ